MNRMNVKNSAKTNSWTVTIILLVLCAAALLIRVQYVRTVDIVEPIRADAREYTTYALNLFKHHTFSKDIYHPRPDSWRSPGYPLILTAVLAIGDLKKMIPITTYLQVAMGLFSVVVVFLLGRRIMPDWAALSAAGLTAISPHLIATTSYILTEASFSFFLLLAMYSFYRAWEKGSAVSATCSGLLFGCAYLINETSLLIPGILAIAAGAMAYRQFPQIKRRKIFGILTIFFICSAILPGVWTLRNSRLPEGALKGSNRATAALSHGAYPGFIYQNPMYKYFPYQEDPLQPGFGENLHNFSNILWDRFRQRPVRYISWYIIEKPYYLWHWDNFQSNKGATSNAGKGDVYLYPVRSSLYLTSDTANLTRLFMKNLHPLLLLLTLVGVFVCGRRVLTSSRKSAKFQTPVFLFIILVYYTGLYMVFAPFSRYSVPLRPELYLCSMWVLNELRIKISALSGAERTSVKK